jgi:hypothetical protein
MVREMPAIAPPAAIWPEFVCTREVHTALLIRKKKHHRDVEARTLCTATLFSIQCGGDVVHGYYASSQQTLESVDFGKVCNRY